MQWEKLSETIQIAINDAHRFGTDAFLLEHFAAVRGVRHYRAADAAPGTPTPVCNGGGNRP